MLPREHPDRIPVAFDDHHLVANAGLMLPATLALRLGLGEPVDRHVDLGSAPGQANTARGAPTSRRRLWEGCVMPEPRATSRRGPTAASTTIPSSPSASGCRSTSPSSCATLEPAPSYRGHTRRELDGHSPLDGGHRRHGRG